MLLRKVVQSGLHLYLLVTTSLLILEKNDNRIVSITLFDIFFRYTLCLKPGSHTPPKYLRGSRRYCLRYYSVT